MTTFSNLIQAIKRPRRRAAKAKKASTNSTTTPNKDTTMIQHAEPTHAPKQPKRRASKAKTTDSNMNTSPMPHTPTQDAPCNMYVVTYRLNFRDAPVEFEKDDKPPFYTGIFSVLEDLGLVTNCGTSAFILHSNIDPRLVLISIAVNLQVRLPLLNEVIKYFNVHYNNRTYTWLDLKQLCPDPLQPDDEGNEGDQLAS